MDIDGKLHAPGAEPLHDARADRTCRWGHRIPFETQGNDERPPLALRRAHARATALAATSAMARTPPPAITINGSATVVSDYRFRGISQTNRHFAVQGGLTVSHESGLYVDGLGFVGRRLCHRRQRSGTRPDRRLREDVQRHQRSMSACSTIIYPETQAGGRQQRRLHRALCGRCRTPSARSPPR